MDVSQQTVHMGWGGQAGCASFLDTFSGPRAGSRLFSQAWLLRLFQVLSKTCCGCPPLSSHRVRTQPKWPPGHLHPHSQPGSRLGARNSIGATSSHLESWGKLIP